MHAHQTALKLLPESMRKSFSCVEQGIEEIRLRLGQVPSYISCGKERAVSCDAVSERDILSVLERATGASMHSAAAAMAQGYVDAEGLRIGVCGTVASNGNFRSFSSLAIRIPHAPSGICNEIITSVFADGLHNCLIISPPGFGKTTALREIIRVLSERGSRVGVIDERSEIGGIMQFKLGRCTDVLTGVDKLTGAMMLLRGMNVEMIAMDEITKPDDIEAISEISGCGVKLLATAHSSSFDELIKRKMYREMLDMRFFEYIITIKYEGQRRIYELTRTVQ